MDTWKRIKKYLSKENERCIIIEENGPSYLIMRMDDRDEPIANTSIEPEIERVNRDIIEWKAKQKDETAEEIAAKEEEIKVEDLPF